MRMLPNISLGPPYVCLNTKKKKTPQRGGKDLAKVEPVLIKKMEGVLRNNTHIIHTCLYMCPYRYEHR